jgi:endonuclease YncB( thermonuclease family)
MPSSVFPKAFASIILDLNSNDQMLIKTTLINSETEFSKEFVYIVQVEDDLGYVVYLESQNIALLPNSTLDITFEWRSEQAATIAIRSFVWSGFVQPIPLSHPTLESVITLNGEEAAVCAGSAECFSGIVSRVVDGDTLDVGDIRIRLSLVNTPERGAEGFDDATEFTAALCPVGSRVLVDQDDGQLQDDFGRILAKITCSDTKNLNSELIVNGYAEILAQYCVESEFSAEDWARNNGCV